jgi:hypothetical protein
MKKMYQNFPVYIIENWKQISEEKIEELIPIIVQNQKDNTYPGGASFWVTQDPTQDFANLYQDFLKELKSKIEFTTTFDNISYCNVYYSTDQNFKEVLDPHGRVYYHNHKHVQSGTGGNSTKLAGVYYMNVPDPNSGSIEFRRTKVVNKNGEIQYTDEDARYHLLSKEPIESYEGVKESITEEFWYQPKNGDLILFPAFLEHRPHRTLLPNGHRIAVNFELKTMETAQEIINRLDAVVKN